MNRRLSVLLVLVLLLSGCGGSQIDSIRKSVSVVLLVSLVAFTSLAHGKRPAFQAVRSDA